MARERTRFEGVRLGRTRSNRAGGRSGGRSIGFRLKSTTKGFNAVERRLQRFSRLSKDIDAALRAVATSGMKPGKAAKSELQSRSAWDNARLWNTHRKSGRNPFVYSPSRGVDIFKAGANDVIHERRDTMRHALLRVAEYMLDVVERRIAGEVGMKPLATSYAKWKKKYAYGKPILVLTGQLLKSLKPVVVMIEHGT